MREPGPKPFGRLFLNDIFLYENVVYQKQDQQSAFSPALQESRRFSLNTIVEHVSYGIWPK